MSEIVLDIETQNTFQDVGKYDCSLLRVSLVGVYDTTTDAYESYLESELPNLWPKLEHAERLIGYNINGFDLPVLNNYYAGNLLRLPFLDIMDEITKVLGFRPKLDDVAHATLGIRKSGHGLKAIEYFKNGEMDKLRAYCLDDVRITKLIYDFGLQHGMVRYTDMMGKTSEVKVDFKKKEERSAVNLTLGL